MNLIPVCLFVVIPCILAEPDYYWRPYNKRFMFNDAVAIFNPQQPSKIDQSNITQYLPKHLRRVYTNGTLFIGEIAYSTTNNSSTREANVHNFTENLEILCSGSSEFLGWIVTTKTKLKTVPFHFVLAGYDDSEASNAFIGRTTVDEILQFGKVLETKGIIIGDSELDNEAEFEILVYNNVLDAPDYYWRPFFGILPPDILITPGTLFNLYIGKIYIPGKGFYVGTLEKNALTIDTWIQSENNTKSSKSIEVLCTKSPLRFEWIFVNENDVQQISKHYHLVEGGIDLETGKETFIAFGHVMKNPNNTLCSRTLMNINETGGAPYELCYTNLHYHVLTYV